MHLARLFTMALTTALTTSVFAANNDVAHRSPGSGRFGVQEDINPYRVMKRGEDGKNIPTWDCAVSMIDLKRGTTDTQNANPGKTTDWPGVSIKVEWQASIGSKVDFPKYSASVMKTVRLARRESLPKIHITALTVDLVEPFAVERDALVEVAVPGAGAAMGGASAILAGDKN
ncbi:hypothetical protein PspLS_08672 [Pyricularia sp. CBS 133598]|nr:hypothetical protein PspLS_08672 [Pyricularia sp. CBS 133598]